MARWKPGHSGNPKGRPAGARNKSTAEIKEILEAEVSFEEVVQKLFERAKKGNERAAELLLAYAFGKPVGREEVSIEQTMGMVDLEEEARQSLESLRISELGGVGVGNLRLTPRKDKLGEVRNAEY